MFFSPWTYCWNKSLQFLLSYSLFVFDQEVDNLCPNHPKSLRQLKSTIERKKRKKKLPKIQRLKLWTVTKKDSEKYIWFLYEMSISQILDLRNKFKIFNVNISKNQRRSSRLTPMHRPFLDEPSYFIYLFDGCSVSMSL